MTSNCIFTCKAFCPEMIEDAVKIVNEAIKDKIQVNLIINNRADGNAPQIAEYKAGGQVFNLAIF